MIALIIILSITAVLAVLISIPLYFEIRYIYDDKAGRYQVFFKYLFFKVMLLPKDEKKKNASKSENIKEKDETSKKQFSYEDFKRYHDGIKLYWDDICDILYILFKKSVHTKKLSLYAYFGFDDPMLTGIATGAANALVYNLLSVIERYSNLYDKEIHLNPDFDKPVFYINTHCIIKIKSVHIIVIAVKILKLFFKINGGRK